MCISTYMRIKYTNEKCKGLKLALIVLAYALHVHARCMVYDTGLYLVVCFSIITNCDDTVKSQCPEYMHACILVSLFCQSGDAIVFNLFISAS